MSATGDGPSPPGRVGDQDANGFTLIEALVVVAIMALIGGLAFPRIQQLLDGAHFASARSELLGAAIEARARAIRADTRTRLDPSSDGGALLLDGRIVAELPSGIRVAPQSGRLAFFSDGSASGGSLVLVDRTRRAALAVAPETGLIRWIR